MFVEGGSVVHYDMHILFVELGFKSRGSCSSLDSLDGALSLLGAWQIELYVCRERNGLCCARALSSKECAEVLCAHRKEERLDEGSMSWKKWYWYFSA